MDKPMARDRNDQDLDAHLKTIEREEDPMLQYMRKKQKRKETASGLPRKLTQFVFDFLYSHHEN